MELPGFSFQDNQHILDLIEGHSSILVSLDDFAQTRGGAADQQASASEKYLTKIENDLSSKEEFQKRKFAGKGSRQIFTLHHYAGPVEYNVEDFLEKNAMSTPQSAVDLLSHSTNKIVPKMLAECFTKEEDQSGPRRRSKGPNTVSKAFRTSLNELMTQLKKAYPSFIRCIKPNREKVKNKFVAPMVSKQLQYAGVMSAIQIRQEG